MTSYHNSYAYIVRKTDGIVVGSPTFVRSTPKLITSQDVITDVTGSPKALHNCSNESRKVTLSGTADKAFDIYGTYSGNPSLYSLKVNVVNPISAYLHDNTSHLGLSSGIKSLAIARVPAYADADVQGFIALVEAREIVDANATKAALALSSFATSLARSLVTGGSVKRKLSRQAKRALEALAVKGRKAVSSPKDLFNTVLDGASFLNCADMEWKYGWAPMVETIHGFNKGVQTLEGMRERLVKGVRVYGKVKEMRYEFITSSNYPIGRWSQNWNFKGTKTTRTVATASIVRRLNPSSSLYDVGWFNNLDVVMEINGLKPTAKRLWQLLPLSFVSDWFWNAGNLLESLQTLSAPVGTSFVSEGGMYSESRVTTVTGDSVGRSDTSGEYTESGSVVRTTYTRSLDPLTGGPTLYIPPLNLPTQASKWWSIAQLAFQFNVEKLRR